MVFVHRLSNTVFKAEKALAILLGTAMLVSLAAGVFFRYVLKSPLTWSDETAIFALVWLTFIGGSMSIKKQNAAAVTIFMDKLKGGLKTLLAGMGLLIVLIFAAYILYLSIGWLSSPNILVQRSSSMNLPMIYAYLSVPVSFLFITIHTLDLLAKNFGKEQEGV